MSDVKTKALSTFWQICGVLGLADFFGHLVSWKQFASNFIIVYAGCRDLLFSIMIFEISDSLENYLFIGCLAVSPIFVKYLKAIHSCFLKSFQLDLLNSSSFLTKDAPKHE